MPNNFFLIYKLNRFDSPTGYLLVFFPAVFGLLLASDSLKDLLLVPIFMLGSIVSRGAGFIINDLLDKNIDIQVERTKKRLLASGEASVREAVIGLYISLLISLGLLLLLTPAAIMVGIMTFVMIAAYPLAKRFSYFPQIFLGLTFNLGLLIGYASVKDAVSSHAVALYVACGLWTIGYDTIYAFMDYPDDIKIGVKSMAVFLANKRPKIWVSSCYIMFLVIFSAVNIINGNFIGAFGIIPAGILLFWQVYTLDVSIPKNCSIRFKNNNIVGFILMLFMLIGYLTKIM
jgi:4-hydroxybenzoate polyprenyltransferase